MSEAQNLSQVTLEAEQWDKSGYGGVHYDPSQEKCLTNHVNLTCELRDDHAGLSDCNKVSSQAKIGDASQVQYNLSQEKCLANHINFTSELRVDGLLDCNKSGYGSVHYDPSQQKCLTNHVNLTSELRDYGDGQSDCNRVSLQPKIGDASHRSSNLSLVEDTDNNSKYGQVVGEPLCNSDCQSMLCEPLEQENLIGHGDVPIGSVKCCMMASECRHAEKEKECLSRETSAAEYSCEHGHDGLYDLENRAVGESSKMLDDVVPTQSMKNSSTELSELNQSGKCTFGSLHSNTGGCTEVSNSNSKDQLGPSFQDTMNKSKLEQPLPLPDDTSKSAVSLVQVVQVVLALQSASKGGARRQSGTVRESSCEKSGAALKSLLTDGSKSCSSSGGRHRKTPATKVNSEYTLRSTGRKKGPRSSIEEEAAASEPNINVKNASDSRKRGRKKGQKNSNLRDEFSRMRVHLRYLLHRMRYEQSLIDAYSSEGWRGQSLEKLRPEKELQRAKLDINRSKLKIRALFQRLDAMCAEGRFPESLFDEEGLIDSEDIFCAKCGSKDLSRDNDIILCDGACERGFHQLCLDPPLRTEEIPPGDEGWFCPACDCKFDCVELLNDSLGAKISINDSWENVFPEAAAKAEGGQDDISGLPSDESEDNDYDPDEKNRDRVEEGESTSDESDFSSASEDLGAIHRNDDRYLGLPSDDSEDDDFDPNFVDAEDQPKQESSSSDFTSASEDLDDAINNDDTPSQDGCLTSSSKLVEDYDDSVPVSGRRQVERLDYKKLYDETYGNAPNDSSDDEDWKDAITPKRRKNGHRHPSLSSEGEELKDAVTPKRRKHGHRNASSLTASYDIPVADCGLSNEGRNTCTAGETPPSLRVGVRDDLQTPETSSAGKRNKRQPYKRLGEEVTQRLYNSFKDNQYPDRSTKEKLAGELGLSPKQVSKWFENARWSFNHSAAARLSGKDPISFDQKDNVASEDIASHGVDEAPVEGNKDAQQNSNMNPRSKLDAGETSKKKTSCRSGRRKKGH